MLEVPERIRIPVKKLFNSNKYKSMRSPLKQKATKRISKMMTKRMLDSLVETSKACGHLLKILTLSRIIINNSN